jgi:hypothetical protein
MPEWKAMAVSAAAGWEGIQPWPTSRGASLRHRRRRPHYRQPSRVCELEPERLQRAKTVLIESPSFSAASLSVAPPCRMARSCGSGSGFVEHLAALGAPRGHLVGHAHRFLQSVLLVGQVGDVAGDGAEDAARGALMVVVVHTDLSHAGDEPGGELRGDGDDRRTGWSAVTRIPRHFLMPRITRDLPSSAPCPLHQGPEPKPPFPCPLHLHGVEQAPLPDPNSSLRSPPASAVVNCPRRRKASAGIGRGVDAVIAGNEPGCTRMTGLPSASACTFDSPVPPFSSAASRRGTVPTPR